MVQKVNPVTLLGNYVIQNQKVGRAVGSLLEPNVAVHLSTEYFRATQQV